MQSKANKLFVRLGLALRQNRAALLFTLAWLGANLIVFARLLAMPWPSAALVACCITKVQGGWPSFYQSFTEVVVFGLVASVVVTNVTRRYRPEETCRALASQMSNHVVVVGFTNFGQRTWELVTKAGKPVVVVDDDAARVAVLVRDELPLVLGPVRDRGVLADAAISRAKVVVIATDDLEAAAVVCRLVREANETCELVVRCADEDVGEVLAKTYRARAVSTSRLAAAFIQAQALKLRSRAVVVLGQNEVASRVGEALAQKRVAFRTAPSTTDTAALTAAGVPEADLVVLCEDDLGRNLISLDRIRDLNGRTRIVCRAFHDDAAELLTRPPFECLVLSTSRHASESLARAGVFRGIGIDGP